MVNQRLRAVRKQKRWSQAVAAEKIGVSELTFSRWENGTQRPYLSTLDLLCKAFDKTPQELGYTEDGRLLEEAQEPMKDLVPGSDQAPSNNHHTSLVVPTAEEIALLSALLVGDDVMAKFDESRRKTLLQLLKAASLGLTLPASQLVNPEPWDRLAYATAQSSTLDEATLHQFTRLTESCWNLTNGSEMGLVEHVLPTFMPQIVTLAQQSNHHQHPVLNLASQGHLLSGIIALDSYNLSEMEKHCYSALKYAQKAENTDLQAASLKQLATAHLIANEPNKALHVYQEALPFADNASPLLKSRIYQGLASAYARCGEETEARTFLGRAYDAFPQDFERDPSFLFADSGLSVLHMYAGLTYLDLEEPQKAWEAFAKVEGLAPKIPIGALTQLEFINLQAKTAIALRDQELACTYLEAGIKKAQQLSTKWGKSEAWDIYQQMRLVWPGEPRVRALVELFR